MRKLPKRILLTDSIRLPDPRDAIQSLPPQSAVIFRHYEDPDRANLAQKLMVICKSKKIPLLIAGDVRLATKINADGLHLPENLLTVNVMRWLAWKHPNKILSVSAHSPKALFKAAEASAAFALLSPVFPTQSHPNTKVIGIHRFASWVACSPIPVFALGGIAKKNATRVLYTGAVGWAAIEGLSNNKEQKTNKL